MTRTDRNTTLKQHELTKEENEKKKKCTNEKNDKNMVKASNESISPFASSNPLVVIANVNTP